MHRHALCVRNYWSIWDGYIQVQVPANQSEKKLGPWHLTMESLLSSSFFFSFLKTKQPKNPEALRFVTCRTKMHYWHFKVLWEIKILFSRQLYHKDPAPHIGLHLKREPSVLDSLPPTLPSETTFTVQSNIDTSLASFQSGVWFPASPLQMYAARCFCLLILS